MYSIRVRAGGEVLEAAFSGEAPTGEALRAITQAFALAEAGNIARALCDVREMTIGPAPETWSVLAEAFKGRSAKAQRVALLCSPTQLRLARRFARRSGSGERLGLFTRSEDADEWLAGPIGRRLSRTALHHMGAFDNPPQQQPSREEPVSASA